MKVRGVAGVANNATAVVANVTAVEASENMFFTVYPGSTARPTTSNINGGPGRPVPNLVVMGIGADGYIDVFNSHGETHCIVDVFGYFAEGGGDRFVPVDPSRLFDTRSGHGTRRGKLGHLEPLDIQVSGRSGVPSSGATAVVMNLTVTEPEAPGHVTISPTGVKMPDTSNVNFYANDTVPNLAICKLGKGGKITINGAGGNRHVLADVFGYFSSNGDQLRASPPRRVLDTRIGVGSEQLPVGPRQADRIGARRVGCRAADRDGGRDERDRDRGRTTVVRLGLAGRRVEPRHVEPEPDAGADDREPRHLSAR